MTVNCCYGESQRFVHLLTVVALGDTGSTCRNGHRALRPSSFFLCDLTINERAALGCRQPAISSSEVLICVQHWRFQARLKCRCQRHLEGCLGKCNFWKVSWSRDNRSRTVCSLPLQRTWALLSQEQYPKASHKSRRGISKQEAIFSHNLHKLTHSCRSTNMLSELTLDVKNKLDLIVPFPFGEYPVNKIQWTQLRPFRTCEKTLPRLPVEQVDNTCSHQLAHFIQIFVPVHRLRHFIILQWH